VETYWQGFARLIVTIHTLPATPERWGDIVTVFGRRGNDPGWCWCQRFMEPPLDGTTLTRNRDALHYEVRSASVPPGVLAYVDGTPAGWSRVMPRSHVPLVQRSRALRRILDDDPGAWWITCFAVDRQLRSTASLPPCSTRQLLTLRIMAPLHSKAIPSTLTPCGPSG
jgi:hypothetical protein